MSREVPGGRSKGAGPSTIEVSPCQGSNDAFRRRAACVRLFPCSADPKPYPGRRSPIPPQVGAPRGSRPPTVGCFSSAYRGTEEGSAIFWIKLGLEAVKFEKLFDMPSEARHTSGLAEVPGRHDRLFALDYRSGFIYLLDLPASSRSGQAVVLARCVTGLRGPSACCVVRLANGQWLLMVTEFKVLKPGHNVMFEIPPGLARSTKAPSHRAVREALRSGTHLQ